MLDRRCLLAGGAATLVGCAVPRAATAAGPATLHDFANRSGRVFGVAAGDAVLKDAAFGDLVFRQAGLFAPDYALKFAALQPRLAPYDFRWPDSLVDRALQQGLVVHGHTLIWNDDLPAWVGQLAPAKVGAVLDRHIETVMGHYAGRIESWDVVNEPAWLGSDHPGTLRPGAWADALGKDYIYRAFRRAAAADPSAKLVLNEAWTERSDFVGLAVRKSLLARVDNIQDKGLRLDAVGLQGHLLPQFPSDDAGFADFLHTLAERKVEIYISEFDVDDRSFPEADGLRDRLAAERTRSFFDAVLQVPAVTRVVTWGLSDRYSWMRDPSIMVADGLTRLARPLPYDDMLEAKPMRVAMAEAFARAV